ncbi:hypothetical protein [Lactobacillus crispatus]|nr:hypothetical protein [Lactobacillus crispatus]
MSKIQEFIKKDIERHPKLKKEYEQVDLDLDASVLVKDMCEDLGMSQ